MLVRMALNYWEYDYWVGSSRSQILYTFTIAVNHEEFYSTVAAAVNNFDLSDETHCFEKSHVKRSLRTSHFSLPQFSVSPHSTHNCAIFVGKLVFAVCHFLWRLRPKRKHILSLKLAQHNKKYFTVIRNKWKLRPNCNQQQLLTVPGSGIHLVADFFYFSHFGFLFHFFGWFADLAHSSLFAFCKSCCNFWNFCIHFLSDPASFHE